METSFRSVKGAKTLIRSGAKSGEQATAKKAASIRENKVVFEPGYDIFKKFHSF